MKYLCPRCQLTSVRSHELDCLHDPLFQIDSADSIGNFPFALGDPDGFTRSNGRKECHVRISVLRRDNIEIAWNVSRDGNRILALMIEEMS